MRFGRTGILFLCVLPAWASATHVVTTLADSGAGSLRDAMTQANGSSGDTINFAHGLTGTILLQSPLPNVIAYMIINGPGPTALNINGQGRYQCFSVLQELDLSGVTVENCGSNMTATYVSPSGTLKLVNTNMNYNTTSGLGGAILNDGNLTLADVSFSLNSARLAGGALYNRGYATLSNVAFNGNSASAGGAIGNESSLTMSFGTLAGNTSRNGDGGGAVFNSNPGELSIDRSSFINNSSIQGFYGGGVILNQAGLTLLNATFWLNAADNNGGAIYNSGVLYAGYVTIANNSAPGGGLYNTQTFKMGSSIVARGSSGPNCNGTFSFSSEGYNLTDDSSCNFTGPGDINNTGASLDPNGPQLNGGITPTIALLPNSLAVNRIPPSLSCGTGVTDQRNVPRPQGSGCDIGAFELGAFEHFTAKLELITGLLGRFNLASTFTLGSGFDVLDPPDQALTLRIGTYQVNLPAGSLRPIGSGVWVFAGVVNGTALGIQVQLLGGGDSETVGPYQLTAQGAPANFFGVVSPTILSLTIGPYSGTITPFTPAI